MNRTPTLLFAVLVSCNSPGTVGPKGEPGDLSAGAVQPDAIARGSVLTDVARGALVTANGAGDLVGIGPTSEYVEKNYWTTRLSGGSMVIDLGQDHEGIFQVVFESQPRGSTENLPAWQGASAYELQYGKSDEDPASTLSGLLPAVAPVQGDIFIHRPNAPITARYFKLVAKAANTPGNATNISLFRALTYAPGETTRIAADRLYGVGEPWRAVTIATDWTDFSVKFPNNGHPPLGCYKDQMGIVHLRGLVIGTSITLAFTLPQLCWPAHRLVLPALAATGQASRLDIYANGDVYLVTPPGNAAATDFWFSFDGISFRAEQ